jgi:predicted nucleic acid-binding protein
LKRVVFLDTGVLSSVVFPKGSEENRKCVAWLMNLLASEDVRVCIPEVCDYEVRRKLLHRKAEKQLGRLDQLQRMLQYVPIDTAAMQLAAQLWADGRTRGRPTADDKSLDADVILCAQARLNRRDDEDLVVATTDVGDLSVFVQASKWNLIPA